MRKPWTPKPLTLDPACAARTCLAGEHCECDVDYEVLCPACRAHNGIPSLRRRAR